MSFWRFGSDFRSYNGLQKLLDDPDLSLDDLLKEQDLIPELQAGNSRLIDLLVSADNLYQLADLIYKAGSIEYSPDLINNEDHLINNDLDLENDNDFKSPGSGTNTSTSIILKNAHIATEILSSDIWNITDSITSSFSTMNKLFQILEYNHSLLPIIATSFTKIISNILLRRQFETINFLKSLNNLSDLFLNHIDNQSIMDLLLQIIATDNYNYESTYNNRNNQNNQNNQQQNDNDNTNDDNNIIIYLYKQNFIDKLIDFLKPDIDPSIKTCATDFLKSLISISSKPSNSDDETNLFQNNILQNKNIGPNMLTYNLVSSSIIEKLISYMLQSKSSLKNGVDIIIEIIRKNNSDYDYIPFMLVTIESHPPTFNDSIFLGSMLNLFSIKMFEFNNILLDNDYENDEDEENEKLKTSYGEIIEPLGFTRFKICELIAELLHCSNMSLMNEPNVEKVVKERDLIREIKINREIFGQIDNDDDNEKKDIIERSESRSRSRSNSNSNTDSNSISNSISNSNSENKETLTNDSLETFENDLQDDLQVNTNENENELQIDEIENDKENIVDNDQLTITTSLSPYSSLASSNNTINDNKENDDSNENENYELLNKVCEDNILNVDDIESFTSSSSLNKSTTIRSNLSESTLKSPINVKKKFLSSNTNNDDNANVSNENVEDNLKEKLFKEEIFLKKSPTIGDFFKIQLIKTNILNTILYYFIKFPYNNFIHNVIFDLIQQIINGPMDFGYNKFLAINLFSKYSNLNTSIDYVDKIRDVDEEGGLDLVNFLLNAIKLSEKHEKETKFRYGYMGHLTLISEEVVKFTTMYTNLVPDFNDSESNSNNNNNNHISSFMISQDVDDAIGNNDEWNNYLSENLMDIREKYNSTLGGEKPNFNNYDLNNNNHDNYLIEGEHQEIIDELGKDDIIEIGQNYNSDDENDIDNDDFEHINGLNELMNLKISSNFISINDTNLNVENENNKKNDKENEKNDKENEKNDKERNDINKENLKENDNGNENENGRTQFLNYTSNNNTLHVNKFKIYNHNQINEIHQNNKENENENANENENNEIEKQKLSPSQKLGLKLDVSIGLKKLGPSVGLGSSIKLPSSQELGSFTHTMTGYNTSPHRNIINNNNNNKINVNDYDYDDDDELDALSYSMIHH